MGLDSSEADVSVIGMFEFVKKNVILNGPVTDESFVSAHSRCRHLILHSFLSLYSSRCPSSYILILLYPHEFRYSRP